MMLHYAGLASLCWMCVEALYMYLALVKIFHTYYSKFLIKCCAFGWGTLARFYSLLSVFV